MATNVAVKQALLAKLEVTPQRLSQLVKKRKTEHPMSTEHAVYTLAHDNEIDISKHLSREQMSDVSALVAQLRSGTAGTTAPPNGASRTTSKTAPRPVVVTIAEVNVEKLPGMTAAHAREAKLMAAKVYPILYVFENSARDLIEKVLKAQFGEDWWTSAVPKKVQDAAADVKKSEVKEGWHGRRSREIEYVLLTHLWDIIKHQWKYFGDLFPNQAWAQTIITSDMNVSRRALAHMTPLSTDDVKNIEAAFRKWANQLKAVEDKLP